MSFREGELESKRSILRFLHFADKFMVWYKCRSNISRALSSLRRWSWWTGPVQRWMSLRLRASITWSLKLMISMRTLLESRPFAGNSKWAFCTFSDYYKNINYFNEVFLDRELAKTVYNFELVLKRELYLFDFLHLWYFYIGHVRKS